MSQPNFGVDAILCARVGSSRLPRKILLPVVGKPILQLTLERLRYSRQIARLVVATTVQEEDDEVAHLCDRLSLQCYRGSAEDVLDRVYSCARHYGMQHIAHFGADNPLIDPNLCDDVIGVYIEKSGGWDCVTNNRIQDQLPTYPDGQEVEVISFAALETVWREEKNPRRREHLLSFLRENPQRFRIRKLNHVPDLHHERWTLDYPEDYEFLCVVFENLYPHSPWFSMRDIITFLDENPHVRKINAMHVGYTWYKGHPQQIDSFTRQKP